MHACAYKQSTSHNIWYVLAKQYIQPRGGPTSAVQLKENVYDDSFDVTSHACGQGIFYLSLKLSP